MGIPVENPAANPAAFAALGNALGLKGGATRDLATTEEAIAGAADKLMDAEKTREAIDVRTLVRCSTVALLKALDTTKIKTAYLAVGPKPGSFHWEDGNFSALVTADPLNAVIIKSNAVSSGAGAWVRDFAGRINVGWFGNDTTSIDSAHRVAQLFGTGIFFPAGNYTYGGDGLTGSTIELSGDGPQNTVVILSAGKYLIDDPGLWGALSVEKIRVYGGAGAIRSRFTGTMVQAKQVIRDCEFIEYTGPAISNNSPDSPDWTIENNIFIAANSTTTMGIALKGLTDSNRIFGNSFRRNKVHVKLAEGGNNAYLSQNDFLRFDTGTGRIDVWVVPSATAVNSGSGLWGGPNKFGNENRATDGSDVPVLYADEGSGTYFGDRMPSLTLSTGFINGHRFAGAAVYFRGASPNTPFVRSYTPNVFACEYGPITAGGQRPTYLLEYASGVTPPLLAQTSPRMNLVGPVLYDGDDTALTSLASSFRAVRVNQPNHRQIVFNTRTPSVAAPGFVYVGCDGASGSINQSVWRFPTDMALVSLNVFTVDSAVGSGGVVDVTAVINGASGTILGSFGGASSFGGNFSGFDPIIAGQSLQIALQTNGSAAAQKYLVVIGLVPLA